MVTRLLVGPTGVLTSGLRLELASHSEANEVYIIIKQVGFKIQNNFNYSAMFMAFQEHVTKSNYS